MYSKRLAKRGQRGLSSPLFLQQRTQPRQSAEMARLQHQHLPQVIHRRAVQTGHDVGRGARVPPLGKVRRVVGQRGQVVDGRCNILILQSRFAPAQQKVGRGAARQAKLDLDIALHRLPVGGAGVGETREEIVQRIGPRAQWHEDQANRHGCRHDTVV